ncbi:hypothetical protein [Kitasatospora sp. MAP5-34]|uniref:hypothetical protein n=1 Tax=Kitasatospora sp. MAP5-34 TaxID=3035102 RepID=UPI00247604E5|nr:hypothetical protein [Kitasatospora sp. MAP5-34]MDH6579935.1 hypothetical protein [Kitasatospora sp. MAP5-34]
MIRRTYLALAVAAASALALGMGVTTPAVAATPASGSVVVSESNAYLQQAASAGIVAMALPPGTDSYPTATGASASFPVAGGSANLLQETGSLQLGGSLLVVDAKTFRAVEFTQLAFDDFAGQFTGVPEGSSTPVPLLDPSGDLSVGVTGTTQNFTASEAGLDPAAAQYLDAQLGTGFFVAGQAFGALSVSYTPAS